MHAIGPLGTSTSMATMPSGFTSDGWFRGESPFEEVDRTSPGLVEAAAKEVAAARQAAARAQAVAEAAAEAEEEEDDDEDEDL